MGIRFHHIRRFVAIEAYVLTGPDQEALVGRHVRIVAGIALAAGSRPVHHFVCFAEIVVALETEPRHRFECLGSRGIIVASPAIPVLVGRVNDELRFGWFAGAVGQVGRVGGKCRISGLRIHIFNRFRNTIEKKRRGPYTCTPQSNRLPQKTVLQPDTTANAGNLRN